MKKLIVPLFFIIAGSSYAQNKSYYISPSGNDANIGTSPNAAWKTIHKVNNQVFQYGDVIQFEAGQTFSGATLTLSSEDFGTAQKPIIIKSYGTGKATIHGGSGDAIFINNTEYVEVRDLIVKGNGRYASNGTGVYVEITRNDKMLHGIVIDNIEASGFYWGGIGVSALPGTTKGFENLKIINCTAYENGIAGIEITGAWDGASGKAPFNHKGTYIGYSKAYNNHGLTTRTTNWSGTGILMSGVENGLIEYCEAFENGKDNGYNGGGPVGIWLANAKGCIIQFCESYSNKASKRKDGGGFDIDGGSQYCIIQYCYSHDNDGPGYAMFEWGNKIRFTNNIIRYNISQNDARRNGYGAISFWSNDYKLYDCEVYNNTIYLSDSTVLSGTPSAIRFSNKSMSNLKIRNNIFYVTKGILMLDAPLFDTTVALFQNNNYYSTINKPTFYFGSYFYSIADWKASSPGQETKGNKSMGFSKDPLFINPGGGKNIKPSEGGDLTYMTAYMLQPGSDMIDAGLNLKDEFGTDIGDRDYYNNKVLEGSNFDIGANEFNPLKFIVMPLKFLAFSVKTETDKLRYKWKMSKNENIKEFVLQVSNNGLSFEDAYLYSMNKNTPELTHQATIKRTNRPFVFCRVKSIEKDGAVTFSEVVKIHVSETKEPILFPNPAKETLNIQVPSTVSYDCFVIKDLLNNAKLVRELSGKEALVNVDINSLSQGVYFIVFYSSKRVTMTMKFIKY